MTLDRFSLDTLYTLQYLQDDQLEGRQSGLRTSFEPFNIPVPNTLTGTVYLNGEPNQTFVESGRQLRTHWVGRRDQPYMVSGTVNESGTIIVNWSEPVETGQAKLVVSYEYSLEDHRNELHFECNPLDML